MHALTNLRAWLLAALLLIKAVMAGPTVYTPVKPPITFYWSVTDPYNFTLPSCNQLQITIVINPNTLIQPVPPFSLFVAPIGLPVPPRVLAAVVHQKLTLSTACYSADQRLDESNLLLECTLPRCKLQRPLLQQVTEPGFSGYAGRLLDDRLDR